MLRKLLATMFAITPAAELCILQDFVHVGSSRAQPGPSDPPPWSRLPRLTATLFPRTLSPCVAQTCLRLCGVRRRQLKKKCLRAGFLIFLILVCMLLCGVCTHCGQASDCTPRSIILRPLWRQHTLGDCSIVSERAGLHTLWNNLASR